MFSLLYNRIFLSAVRGRKSFVGKNFFPGGLALESKHAYKASPGQSNARTQDNTLLVELRIKCNLSRRGIRVEDIFCTIS